MNSKSLLFIFALLALFSVSSAHVAEKRDLEDQEILYDAVSLIQKIIVHNEEKEKQRIAESLKTNDDELKDEIEVDVEPIDEEPVEQEEPVDEEPPVEQEQPIDLESPNDGKYMVAMDEENNDNVDNEELGPVDDVEVITVTVEIEEGADVVDVELGQPDLGKNVVAGDIDIDVEEGGEEAAVEGEAGEDVAAEEINIDETEEIVQNPDALGEVEYDVDINAVDTPKEETNYYNVEEGEYNAEEDSYETIVTSVEGDEKGNGGIIGASVAVVGAFGVIGALGYKYTQRKKRVLLPFHEDLLEKDGFYDNAEQHIIPVWAATCKKEENEEEKEDEDKLFEVVYNYEPELPDELKLTVGDKIKIKEIYEDGWAYGYNKTTQLFGTFPSTSLGEDFNPESVPQYKPEEVAVEMNDNMVEELKKKIVESN
ncbi:hypothetical protein BCR32DRAFT_139825 [Anaeromyces robustus]|jgi:hypothetical protein|uniref:SH3 domain-containing protein n=1 Tax=Anaeromyces robustus TaxID=1754192 RepID=A0A1Y1VQT3_9FUNG|nr:hypothetical protein BCR32DRAFT_139825 [Anaeromyces robustus]|eukprot:ORX63523.1 hypothetical protein BCR32DRAFT_139825 [Anaeromyces robustus]